MGSVFPETHKWIIRFNFCQKLPLTTVRRSQTPNVEKRPEETNSLEFHFTDVKLNLI